MSLIVSDNITSETDFFKVFNDKNITEEEKFKFSISYIIAKLKKQAISAMIGAGFSQNANRDYPDWAYLLLDAFNEMHPNTPKRNKSEKIEDYKKRQAQYIRNIGEPKVAEEYEEFKGNRESLDLYIEKQFLKIDISKNDFSTHESLLRLNWNDVITTNWDSILEDVGKTTGYSCVTEAKGLKVSHNKRIVKINGSLRTSEDIKNNEHYSFDGCFDHLYLITSKDFENYGTNHEEFSNFMKVKLLENTFCLFGFSGNDCNFRYWVKELKRLMTKGGETQYPNPIFLFSLENDTQIDNSLVQLYKNNYIVPIYIFKLYSYLFGYDLDNIEKEQLSPSYVFCKIFNYFYEVTNNDKHSENEKTSLSNKKDETKIFNDLQNANNKSLNIEFYERYNKLDKFSYLNLRYTSSCIDKIQSLYADLKNWSEHTFVFIFRWIVGNFYSLTNIYEEEKIENIIKLYFSKNFQNTEAYVFLELILKYYREAQKYNEFDSILKGGESILKLKNICTFEKANLLVDKLNYKELKELLINWTPENDENPDSIFIIRKLSLISTFENSYLTEDERNVIKKTFEKSLEVCNETQYKYFIAIYQKQFLQKHTFEVNYFNQPLIDSLIQNGAIEVYKYLDNFKKNIQRDDYKSNISKRYAITRNLSFSSGNEDLINTIRIFNFFEYTGLPMSMFFHNSKLIEIIPDIKKTEYYLIKILIQAISYFGYDSEEDYMRNILNKSLRFISQENINGFYKACFDILKYKLENKKDIRSYLFLVSELTNYISKENSEDFFDFLYLQIQNPTELNLQLFNLIRRGKVWGIERPFIQFIQRISEQEKFKFILRWVIKEYIEDEKELMKQEHYSFSPFYSYYFELLKKSIFKNEIKTVFSEKEIIKFLEEDFNYEKQLCLYGYEYLSEELKQKTKDYFEKSYSLHTDPYFIKHFKSDELKKHIFKKLRQYNIIAFDSRDYPFSNYIRMLKQENMLSENDKIEVCSILSNYYDQIQTDDVHFKYGFRSLKDTIASLFFCLEDVLTEIEKTKLPETKDAYDKIKKEFINQIQTFYDFKWLYSKDLQQFRLSFSNAISYFSYLHQAKEYVYVINIALTKLIVEDDNNFEAVLELFIDMYSKKYENSVFENDETHNLLIQVMKKFKLEIPYCYDYLFIKKQMQLLAEALNKNNIKNDIINYWLENKD